MKNLASYLIHRLNLRIVTPILLTLAVAMLCPNALAQSGAGSIQGNVTDSTGAIIPGAIVHVENNDTGVLSNAKSNSAGFYQVPNLFTGHYTVTVTAAGMKTSQAKVDLLVAQSAVINPVMSAGDVTQQVEVRADAIQLTTLNSGAISSTLDNDRINQLPMNGRSVLTLSGQTTPGLEASGTRVNGLMAEGLEYVADGVPLTNRNFGGEGNAVQAQLPDPDSVQEVHLETSNSGSMYATPATAVITTKSGTNQFHGSMFETARNNAIGIAKNRSDPSNFSAPHLVRNEFGFSMGGPVIIPHVYNGKGKTFWFFAYERYSLAQVTSQLDKSYTPAMRNGDWSGLYNSAGILQQLYDPTTTAASANCNGSGTANSYCRAPFFKNQIPLSRESPSAKKLIDIIPLPTSTDNPLVTTNLTAPDPIYTVIPNISFRLDQNFNQNSKAYLRYTGISQVNLALRDNPTNELTIAADGIPAGASGYGAVYVKTYGAAAGFTHVFSPTFFSETIVSQEWQSQYFSGGPAQNVNFEQLLGLPNNFGTPGFPDINTSGFGNLFGTQTAYGYNEIISNLDENLTKTLGRHQLQFGGRYRHERFAYLPDQTHDAVTFNGNATGLENPGSGASYTGTSNTGNTDADFFLGDASNYNVNLNAPYIHFHDMEFDGYFQDDFHVSKSLTLNLGLRYEAHPAAWTKNGLSAGFDLKNDAIVLDNPLSSYIAQGFTTQAIVTNLQNLGAQFETPAQAGVPNKLVNDYNAEFAPRLGIAYQPFGGRSGTVLRGGYGRYIYPVPVRSSTLNTVKNVPFLAAYNQSYTAANQAPDGLPDYLLRANWNLATNPYAVQMGTNSSNAINTGSINSILPGQALFTLDRNYAPDVVTEANVTVEQKLKGNSALRVSWQFTHGANLDHAYYYNNAPSTYVYELQTGMTPPTGSLSAVATNPYDAKVWGSNVLDEKNGWSNDNALQVNYQRLFHHGIAYQVTYVWSKPLRAGGNWTRDAQTYTTADYAGASGGTMGVVTMPYGNALAPTPPPARPAGVPSYADYAALVRYAGYSIDTAIPKQHISFNGIIDLPFGTGKRFLGRSNRFVNELVGGFQIAGDGNIVSQDFAVASSNWGATNPIKIYKHQHPITDCRSSVCHPSYLWFNGYIPSTAINGNSCATTSATVSGLPADYAPYSSPIDTDCVKTDAANKYYGSNEVAMTLLNGTTSALGYSPGPAGANPFAHTVLDGPINYTIDLSVFKIFPITEKVNLRFNVDAFNALNVQGFNNPNATDGTEAVEPGTGVASSHNTPRQLQFTARLTF
jgi:hypothetical protein